MNIIHQYNITLDQEDIDTLEDTNMDTRYSYIIETFRMYSCKGFMLLHKLVLLS